jgi:hypothetical protein
MPPARRRTPSADPGASIAHRALCCIADREPCSRRPHCEGRIDLVVGCWRQAAARSLGMQLVIASARTDSDLEPAFATSPGRIADRGLSDDQCALSSAVRLAARIDGRAASAASCSVRWLYRVLLVTRTAPTCCCERVAKAVSRSLSVLAYTTTSCRPSVRAAACRSVIMDWVGGE